MAVMNIYSTMVILAAMIVFSQATQNDNLIQKTCNQTHFNNLCVETLVSRLSAVKSPANLTVFADIFVREGKAKIAETYQYVYKLLETKYKDDPVMKQLLHYCQIDYDNDSRSLVEVQLDLKHEMFIDAKAKLAQVLGDGEECEELFERSVQKSPITRSNKLIDQISTIIDDILNQILG